MTIKKLDSAVAGNDIRAIRHMTSHGIALTKKLFSTFIPQEI
ncbi:hypothetical protein RBEAN4_0703 [Rickettsia bellii str. RML An4]|uniref:Uncharacterized protein n=1 Tax=Rickettsia bellii str. RML An4 TaxID=1359193 RepID=A0A0F3QBU2_RICBE|nr:hypothetical protein RBEAN4_0703 [Rickettsia bellii str. RML An4]